LPLKGNFTYVVPSEHYQQVVPGSRVAVQFGRHKIHTGIVRNTDTVAPASGTVKPLLDVLDDTPVVNEKQLQFWEWMSGYYLCHTGEVMAAALPSGFRLESETSIEVDPDFGGDLTSLSKNGLMVVENLMVRERMSLKEVSELTSQAKVVNLVRTLIDLGVVRLVEEVKERYTPRTEPVYHLHPDHQNEASLSSLMDMLAKRAYRQLEAVMVLASELKLPEGDWNEIVPLSVFRRLKGHLAILKSLVDRGVLVREEREVSRLAEHWAIRSASDIVLSGHQQEAIDAIRMGVSGGKPCLLHGVTGSGKTEIYIRLIEECLASGRQALYLLPEIALTTQIVERLRKYFGEKVGIYHSRYSNAERVEIWKEVLNFRSGSSDARFQVVLGARSSLFLPYNDLGLIIVDEEHDPSFKQIDPAPRYHARDSALFLARLHSAAVVMGSATPSVDSYANATNGTYTLVELNKRYSEMLLPEILVADLREEKRRKTMRSHFSSLLLEKVSLALENKEQVIMFQNRRGFSLRLECDACQWMPHCRNCDVTLIYHKQQQQLRCHYCGYTEKVPSHCPECGSPRILMQGFGTEKVEEELQDIYRDARVVRMDLDTTRTRTAFQRIINQFEHKEIDILVGTQMVTKGLDFDHVNTVGILNADNMLSFPDFRASERSFQLMAQVSGRSGRRNKRGIVVIQTAQPYHSVIRQVIDHDFVSMFNDQMAERKQFGYPPFTRLIMLRVRHRDSRLTAETAQWIADRLRLWMGKRVLGPEYPMVARIRNEYIKNILIKVERDASVKEAKHIINRTLDELQQEALYRRVRVQVDVDPY
jgi:primosomal protein N' (replication factor Y)